MSQVSIIALKNNEIRVVKASMLGSILSNMLFCPRLLFPLGGDKASRATLQLHDGFYHVFTPGCFFSFLSPFHDSER